MNLIIYLLFFVSAFNVCISINLADIDVSKPLNTTVELPPGKNVTFRLYTRHNTSAYEVLTLGDNSSSLLPDQPVKVVTHGWMGDGFGEPCEWIVEAYLSQSDYNVIIVDWGDLASNIIYVPSAEMTKPVGAKIGEMIESLMITYGFNGSSVHLIGHSIGAHAMGYAGRYLKGRNLTVAEIIGLDPAAPLFDYPTQEGLMSSDADFVQVIHTNGWYLGTHLPRGHVDFYPNGGGPTQPGCNVIILLFEGCAHTFSYKLFIESITLGGFTSQRCDSYSDYRKGECSSNVSEHMGEGCSTSANGTFYLKTNGESRYSLD